MDLYREDVSIFDSIAPNHSKICWQNLHLAGQIFAQKIPEILHRISE
jgi:hypothetical protein